ncbi:ion transporter [Lentimicrobium sp.]|jgi:voltage-gated potassium channel|uniref:ion transporter n=1 Tax=Lentimicrobium sp. TaxID=2034841 RepID=UPI0025FD4D05|nr:ion transporter [Lentimicrobium sp.]MCO5255418.1 ion transporter [Lentimicrobium sp.]MCO5261725.1 ion transporter [Lentimicrobium sp.]HOP14506.1 ion transporter [Lentimicrobium sp.]HPF63241.1 ion transporter [Lentimicrobium sp.]HPJ61041.1 ion transporter [Lentimicrobium sp.]
MIEFSENEKLKRKIYKIIFEADTPAGKLFDVVLIWSILLSVALVVVESVHEYHEKYQIFFIAGEWLFTILFTLEYILRIYVIRRKTAYIFSFFGVVDLMAILPTYISLLFPGTHYLMVIRILRLMRVFRVFKLSGYLTEATILRKALLASSRKILVFLSSIAVLVVVIGAIMYVIEGPEYGFKDIPTSIYWAVVTLTTVGYGDISPQTGVGQFFASVVMVLGYAIIAVPTGIMTVELSAIQRKKSIPTTKVCPECMQEGHDGDAKFCKYCGHKFIND